MNMKMTNVDDQVNEMNANFSKNYEFTTSIDDELKALMFATGS